MCGNEYIRALKGRVDRRDEEIDSLRREVRRLRVVLEQAGVQDGFMGDANMVDLERDIDAIELSQQRIRTIMEEDDVDDED